MAKDTDNTNDIKSTSALDTYFQLKSTKGAKTAQYIITGMNRDTTISLADSKLSYENMNIRITARDNNTLLSVTNERGNRQWPVYDSAGLDFTISGIVVGWNVLNSYLILFTHEQTVDHIYRLTLVDTSFLGKELISGSMNFSTSNPIESLCSFETSEIQKIYWVDGVNQPRMLNIMASDAQLFKIQNNLALLDFVNSLQYNETITVTRDSVSSGVFPSGVIQYAFSYYNLYGQESNIFKVSPLYYTSFNTRGGSPEDKVSNSFTITVTNPDTSFDYVRVYSILRTSLEAVPTVKRLTDLAIQGSTLTYTDNGTTGNTVDPTQLLYVGGEAITAYTMTQKDDTLFLGNINLKRELVSPTLRAFMKKQSVTYKADKTIYPNGIPQTGKTEGGHYLYRNQLGSSAREIKTFKYLETYRFGVQFQHKTGKWSEPVWINDVKNNVHPVGAIASNEGEKLVTASCTVNGTLIYSLLNDAGYVRMRPVIVYPQLQDRNCICQGILCPTVFNMEDRVNNAPFAQSSWFARPFTPYNLSNVSAGENTTMQLKGAVAEFRHLYPLPDNAHRNGEIQCMDRYYTSDSSEARSVFFTGTASTVMSDRESYTADKSEMFFVDQSIFTFHSPDIEFNNEVQTIDASDLKLRIIGLVPLTSSVSDISIETSTPPMEIKQDDVGGTDSSGNPVYHITGNGFVKHTVSWQNISTQGYKILINGPMWQDEFAFTKDQKLLDLSNQTYPMQKGYVIYPWQRNGSLNSTRMAEVTNTNDTVPTYKSAMLKQKKLSNMRYSFNTKYFDEGNIWNAYVEGSSTNTGISGVILNTSDQKVLTRIPAPINSGFGDLSFYNNVDKVITYSPKTDRSTFTGDNNLWYKMASGYDLMVSARLCRMSANDSSANMWNAAYGTPYWVTSTDNADKSTDDATTFSNLHPWVVSQGNDPISMKYKCAPNAVMALNYTSAGLQRVLPYISGDSTNPVNVNYSGKYAVWDTSKTFNGFSQDSITADNESFGFLWLGELYNDNVKERFGGQTEEAFMNNRWLPCGDAVNIVNGNMTVTWNEGDTYYQRYDHLKCYPFTLEDQNSITDIVSFMCETRVNIDGRYDRNRGQDSNLVALPKNFNLWNEVYSQPDDFFVYHGVNHDVSNPSGFPNQLTWTMSKQPGADVDAWTDITLANTVNLDGDKGPVEALRKYNNEIICFQDRGISNIIFNPRVQLNTTDGVPIEVNNSGKVEGKRYLKNSVGCFNKWSIVETPSGLYFMDNITNSIYLFNGDLKSLSDEQGFRQWVNVSNSNVKWDPVSFKNFVTYYDKNNNDVYFTNSVTSLCYSELLNKFTSFMSYESLPGMFNIGSDFYSIKTDDSGVTSIYKQFAGKYNIFFGDYKPFYITFRVNPDIKMDKIFNTIDYRADMFDDDGTLTKDTFDTLEVWNEYQHGLSKLTDTPARNSSIRKKFRIWRAQIPRSDSNNRDRIRNPWIYLKLESNTRNILRMDFHDMIVNYFE